MNSTDNKKKVDNCIKFKNLDYPYKIMEFTDNEKELLKILVDNGRTTDVEIAEKLKISPQAAGKIRKKLEADGVIKNYCANLDFEKLGINSFVLFKVSFTPEFWKSHNIEKVRKFVSSAPQIIISGKLFSPGNHLFCIEGFRNQKELEEYISKSRVDMAKLAKYTDIETFSSESIMKLSLSELYKMALDEKIPHNPPTE